VVEFTHTHTHTFFSFLGNSAWEFSVSEDMEKSLCNRSFSGDGDMGGELKWNEYSGGVAIWGRMITFNKLIRVSLSWFLQLVSPITQTKEFTNLFIAYTWSIHWYQTVIALYSCGAAFWFFVWLLPYIINFKYILLGNSSPWSQLLFAPFSVVHGQWFHPQRPYLVTLWLAC
jgi:hypothetical protein